MGWILPPVLFLLGLHLVCSDGLQREKFQYASRRIQEPAFLESAALEDKGGRDQIIASCYPPQSAGAQFVPQM